jgi:hypothetical protein
MIMVQRDDDTAHYSTDVWLGMALLEQQEFAASLSTARSASCRPCDLPAALVGLQLKSIAPRVEQIGKMDDMTLYSTSQW